MNQQQATFLWHDYETWGVNPAWDRPAQFAAIRTDMDLNPIGEPLMVYAKPTYDMLPNPEACLITGITPQFALQHGISESAFIGRIQQEMMQSNTCSVGFNSIRFDDEVTRYTLYRNFYDAYEREWKNGNSRWDVIDVVRLCGALRPEGIQWPKTEEGLPSYRLEHLTAANNIEQIGAHDALVDVRATIAVAKLIKTHQPKLFDYAFSMRNKQAAMKALNMGSLKPVFHISGMFGSANYCASIVLPLCMHPSNKNAVICFDLRQSPTVFLQATVEELRARLFSKALAGEPSVGLKNIHLNKSPMICPIEMVTPEVEQRMNLSLAQARIHYKELKVNQAAWMKAQAIFEAPDFPAVSDPEAMLYSGGFFSNADKALMQRIVKSSPEALAKEKWPFEDARLETMLFRYKARNSPEILSEQERAAWEQYRFQRLTNPEMHSALSAEAYQKMLEELFQQVESDDKKSFIVSELMDWLDMLLA